MFVRLITILVTFLSVLSIDAQLSYQLSNKFWRLRSATINGKDYSFGSGENAPTLQFSGGSMRGNGGCNAYHTKFTINGAILTVEKVMSTRMACNDLTLEESEYFEALSKTHRLEYEEGSNQFRLVNFNNDVLDFYVQFERAHSSYTPPVERRREFVSRHSSYRENPAPKLSKKQLARKKLLEKKLNSKKGKLTKKERRELIVLQSKEKKKAKVSRGKKSKRDSKGRVAKKKTTKKDRVKAKAKKAKASKAKKNIKTKKSRR